MGDHIDDLKRWLLLILGYNDTIYWMMCGNRRGRVHGGVAEDGISFDRARFESWLKVKRKSNTSRI